MALSILNEFNYKTQTELFRESVMKPLNIADPPCQIKHQNCYWYEVYCYSITSSRSNISFSPILSMSHRLLTLVWSWTILPWPRVKAMLFPGTNDKLSTFMGGTIFGSWNLNLSLLFCHSVESGPYFGGNMQHPIGLIKLILLFSNIALKGFVEGTN